MKPIVGLTMTKSDKKYSLNAPYVQSILDAGGVPLCIPFGVEKDVDQLISTLDGLLLTGGVDIHPHFFNEEPHLNLGEVSLRRDQVEIALAKVALKKKLPIFAICRGIQLLNIVLGGGLFQDINTQFEKEPLLHNQKAERHEASHFVTINSESLLYKIIGNDKIAVNSLHHQAIKDVPHVLLITAKASDGIVEAVELKDYPFCIAVQWHPEEMAVAGDKHSKALFAEFIQACTKYKI
ncbi:gamma-glutamyl-gamma-aminobutyrate hydrolase family protein [Lysinibacillus telephonicus]|uniref:gamma-glutamyl-gamma-aminobutyrate hydrolase family protein n=1 Tax=Lysinibacillus telephonicus TaxID=1714840 RepID=UPI003BA08B63